MSADVTSQQFESYVPVYDAIPDSWEEAKPFLVEQLKKISNAVNVREIGWFLDEELLSGKAFIPTAAIAGNNPSLFRQVLRKVIDFGPLPGVGPFPQSKSVPHGITFDANFTLTAMYAAATDPVAFIAFPIPYAEPTVIQNQVSLTMDATNVNITVGINRSSFTRCFVTIEYMQEV